MREVVAAADMVEVVSGRTLAAQGRRALLGPLPVPRGADAELLGQPGRQALPLLRLRQGRRRDHVRPRDGEPRLRRRGRVAGRALPGHARVRGDLAAARGVAQAARPAARRARPGGRRSTSGTSGSRRRARRCAPTWRAAASARRSAASSGSGSRRGAASRRRRRRRASPRDELRGAGLTNARGQRLLPAAADVPARRRARPDRRLPGAQAARGRPAAGQVRQLARGRALPQVGDPLRPPPGADRDREAGARRRRRGEHRRDRAAPGRRSSPSSPRWGRR